MAVILALGIVVIAALAVVYVLAGQILVHWIVGWFRKGRPTVMRSQRIYRLCIVGVTLLSLSCVAYAYFVEPCWLEVTHVCIVTEKMQRGCKPFRLVQISDLHCCDRVRLETELPGVIAAQKPDAIVFTGDAINTPLALGTFKTLMKSLSKIAPTYAVRGNWDQDRSIDLYGDTGVKELDHEFVHLEAGGSELYLLGLPAALNPQPAALVQKVPARAFKVLLFHYPEVLGRVQSGQIDLILSGHTHGGQVALPWYGAVYLHTPLGKLLERGLYVQGQTYLYINRGIGMTGSSLAAARFLTRPEVTVIDITPP